MVSRAQVGPEADAPWGDCPCAWSHARRRTGSARRVSSSPCRSMLGSYVGTQGKMSADRKPSRNPCCSPRVSSTGQPASCRGRMWVSMPRKGVPGVCSAIFVPPTDECNVRQWCIGSGHGPRTDVPQLELLCNCRIEGAQSGPMGIRFLLGVRGSLTLSASTSTRCATWQMRCVRWRRRWWGSWQRTASLETARVRPWGRQARSDSRAWCLFSPHLVIQYVSGTFFATTRSTDRAPHPRPPEHLRQSPLPRPRLHHLARRQLTR
jgi:hypothetical protein